MKIANAKSDLQRDLAGNPFAGLAEMVVGTVQLQWGWVLLIGGVVLVTTAVAIKEDTGNETVNSGVPTPVQNMLSSDQKDSKGKR